MKVRIMNIPKNLWKMSLKFPRKEYESDEDYLERLHKEKCGDAADSFFNFFVVGGFAGIMLYLATEKFWKQLFGY